MASHFRNAIHTNTPKADILMADRTLEALGTLEMARSTSSATHADCVAASEISAADQPTTSMQESSHIVHAQANISKVLSIGDKIHIIHRQLFDGDTRRHFVGTVEACDGSLVRVRGYLFTLNPKTNEFIKHDPEPRTRIVALTADSLIINLLPPQVDIDKLTYMRTGNEITVTDGSEWHLGLSHL